jgi:CRP-like cAMP-binding protein
MRPANVSPSQWRVLQRNAWFAALDPALQLEIARRSSVRRHPARSTVYLMGSPPSGFYVVLAGEIRLETVTRSGKFAFYQALRPPDTFGLLSEIDGSLRFSDARAWGDTTLLHLGHADCLDLYRHDEAARAAFVELICQNLHTTLAILVEEHSAPPRVQIASLLVSLLSREEGDARRSHKLTHDAIAAMAGVSRQTASKVLHEFEALRLIAMHYGRLSALDLPGLQNVAQA